jgi:hypothetical protein
LQRQFARLSAEAAFGEEADGAVQDLIAALTRGEAASWLLGSLLFMLFFMAAFLSGGPACGVWTLSGSTIFFRKPVFTFVITPVLDLIDHLTNNNST